MQHWHRKAVLPLLVPSGIWKGELRAARFEFAGPVPGSDGSYVKYSLPLLRANAGFLGLCKSTSRSRLGAVLNFTRSIQSFVTVTGNSPQLVYYQHRNGGRH